MSLPGVVSLERKAKPPRPNLRTQSAVEFEKEWKRDFEEDGTLLGELRGMIKQADRRLIYGATIRVRHLSLTSPLLQYSLPDVMSLVRSCFGLFSLEKLTSKRRVLLDDISFSMPARSMTLVLGSPGSGKSSLCKVIAQQDVRGTVDGEVLFGGEQQRKKDNHHRVSYVRDGDSHLPFLTVKQTFTFADALLNPASEAPHRDQKVAVMLRLLGLSHRADTMVGDDLHRGVSGGERRRVSIGVELLKSSQVLVLDEATNGLDSTTALQIFQAVRVIADEMIPVMATLKQPARELYQLFDQVLLLHKGSQIYFGRRDGALEYFESLGFDVNFAQNPADEILRILHVHGSELEEMIEQKKAEKKDSPHTPGECEDEHEEEMPLRGRLQRADTKVGGIGEENQMHRYRPYARTFFMQFMWYIKRGYQMHFNFPMGSFARVIFAAIVAFIIGTLFFQLGDSQADVNSLSGVTFLIASFAGFQALAGLPGVFARRPIFYYQKRNHYYHPLPSTLAQWIVDLPVSISESVLFATISYWLVGLRPEFGAFVYFILCVFVIELVFLMITTTTGFLTKNFLMANILVPPIIFGLNYFSGFVIVESRCPEYLQWLFWVSPFRYLIEGLMINELLGVEFMCEDDEFEPPRDIDGFYDSWEMGGYEGQQVCPVTLGDQILIGREYHTEEAYKWYWLLVLFGFFLLFFVITLISKYVQHKPPIPRDLQRAEDLHQKHLKPLRAVRDSITGDDSDDESEEEESKWTVTPKRLTNTTPVHIEFRDICYFVPIPAKEGAKGKAAKVPCFAPCTQVELPLLDNVSGYVQPGMVVAFMGPSGAGKTTLLDVLSLRKTAGRMTGTIKINGQPMDTDMFPRYSGYVEQMNLHVETETVKEALELAAKLRLDYSSEFRAEGRTLTWAQRHAHIAWVMEVLGLWQVRHAMIQELNLEQKKRVTIGVELAANPSLLWLDEPTTGLDGLAALRIMQAVQDIAKSGVAVVCTLHQPSKQIFSMCSDLLLLRPGGKVGYFGSIADGGAEAAGFFEKQGFFLAPERNQADFFLDCVSSKDVDCSESYRESEIYSQLMQKLDEGLVPAYEPPKKSIIARLRAKATGADPEPVPDDVVDPPLFNNSYAAWWPWQVLLLSNRNARYWWRNPEALVGMLVRSLAFGLLLGIIFSEAVDHSQAGATERVTVIYFLVMVLSSSVMAFVPQIFEERPVLYRETAAKTYRTSAYVVALVLSALPILAATSLLAMFPPFFIAGLRGGWWHIGYFVGFGLLTSLLPYGFVLALCSIAPTAEAGNGLVGMVNIVGSLTAGFLITKSQMPSYWIWAYWTAYLKYALEGLLVNELDGRRFECKDNEGALPVPMPMDPNVPYEDQEPHFQYYCRIEEGKDILDQFDMNPDLLTVDLFVLLGMFAGLLLFALVMMIRCKHIRR